MTKKQEPSIEDCFSKQAEIYARHRPEYPETLFKYIAELCPAHELAWDCGTGSGQAALGLVKYFNQVIASDQSPIQIAHARFHERILYQVSSAEKADLETQSADLITVAQALHWFKLSSLLHRSTPGVKAGRYPGSLVLSSDGDLSRN